MKANVVQNGAQTVGTMAENDKDRETPYPESGFSPALQRTLKAKFDRAEEDPSTLDAVDRDEFFKLLGKTTRPEQHDGG